MNIRPHRSFSVLFHHRLTALFVLCLAASGCWGSDEPRPVRVTGKIEYNGQPLTHGTVAFVPVEVTTGHAARGTIGPDGSFELTTFQIGDGAFPGDYVVTVFAYDGTRDVAGSSFQAVGPSVIPQRYNKVSTTDLLQTVGDKRMEVKLDLKD